MDTGAQPAKADAQADCSGDRGAGRVGRAPRRAVRPGAEREVIYGASWDEQPKGWNDPDLRDSAGLPVGTGAESNDEQLKRDIPPHHGLV